MKKFSIIFTALCAMLLVVSCNKEEYTDPTSDQCFIATVDRLVSDNGAKMSLSGTSLSWSQGDTIKVYDKVSNAALFCYTGSNGKFKWCKGAVLSADTAKRSYAAFYPADLRTFGTSSDTMIKLPQLQYYGGGGLPQLPLYAESKNDTLRFRHLCGVVCFSFSSPVELCRISVVTDKLTNGTSSVKFYRDTTTGSLDSIKLAGLQNGSKVATLSCEGIGASSEYYMYLPANKYNKFSVQLTDTAGAVCLLQFNNTVVRRDQITTLTVSATSFQQYGFSTSDSTSVVFSSGNLQYQASTKLWRFAEMQYDYVGAANSMISESNSGWIDLFGWATSGWNNGNTYYQPYESSFVMDTADTTICGYGYGLHNASNLVNGNANADWGVYNAIVNGGNEAGRWRTLTNDEWTVILKSRHAATVGGTADARFAKVVVNHVRGVLLFPDNYTHPANVHVPGNINNDTSDYDGRNYSVAEWVLMESNGAVFLPAAGYRNGQRVSSVNEEGYYWSSSNCNRFKAYGISFYTKYLQPAYSGKKYHGWSVRLVKDMRP